MADSIMQSMDLPKVSFAPSPVAAPAAAPSQSIMQGATAGLTPYQQAAQDYSGKQYGVGGFTGAFGGSIPEIRDAYRAGDIASVNTLMKANGYDEQAAKMTYGLTDADILAARQAGVQFASGPNADPGKSTLATGAGSGARDASGNLVNIPTPNTGTNGAGGGVTPTGNLTPGGSTQAPFSGLPGTAYNIAGVNPNLRSVNFETDTTSGNLNRILSEDGPLMQRAQALSLMQANAKGLSNTSMAAGAGTAAMIDAATPIAKADADTYNQVASENQKYANAATVFNSQAYNEAQAAGFNASQKMLQMKFSADTDMAIQQVKNDASIQMANIEAEYKTTMQASESARSLYSQVSKNITDIMMSDKVPATEKGALVQQQSELLRSGLAVAAAGTNQDFIRILDFTGGAGSRAVGDEVQGAAQTGAVAGAAQNVGPNVSTGTMPVLNLNGQNPTIMQELLGSGNATGAGPSSGPGPSSDGPSNGIGGPNGDTI